MNDTVEQEVELSEKTQTNLKKNNDSYVRDNSSADAPFGTNLYGSHKELKTKLEEDVNLEIENRINKSSLGPGLILKNMREEAKLSKEDVAKELRLSTRHVEYLENDEYDKFSALVFYLGNIRHYSNLLNLDPDKMIAKFHAVYKIVPENLSFKAVKAEGWQESWPMNLLFSREKSENEKNKNITVLLTSLVVVVVFFVLWWLLSSTVLKNKEVHEEVKLESEQVMQLPPEQVDNLLPTQPVIVQNNKENLNTINTIDTVDSNNTNEIINTVPKRNKLDDFS